MAVPVTTALVVGNETQATNRRDPHMLLFASPHGCLCLLLPTAVTFSPIRSISYECSDAWVKPLSLIFVWTGWTLAAAEPNTVNIIVAVTIINILLLLHFTHEPTADLIKFVFAWCFICCKLLPLFGELKFLITRSDDGVNRPGDGKSVTGQTI